MFDGNVLAVGMCAALAADWRYRAVRARRRGRARCSPAPRVVAATHHKTAHPKGTFVAASTPEAYASYANQKQEAS